MTVIGRLDEQVDAVLIAPLKRKPGATETAEQKEQTESEVDRERAATLDRARRTEGAAHQRAADELPVWLL